MSQTNDTLAKRARRVLLVGLVALAPSVHALNPNHTRDAQGRWLDKAAGGACWSVFLGDIDAAKFAEAHAMGVTTD